MATNSTTGSVNRSLKMPKWTLVIVAAITVAAVAWWVTMMNNSGQPSTMTNHAQEVAKPIEDALAREGATFKSRGGDSGHGADNLRPYYDSFYDVPKDKDAAIALVDRIASDNGYKLTHASTTNRGNLGAVADKYIDSWYFDITSHKSTFADLEDGVISLAFSFGDADHPDSAGHTTVRISVQLPDVKK